MSERPDPIHEAPEGYRWEAVPKRPRWRVTDRPKRCVRRLSVSTLTDGTRQVATCQRPAVAELNRSRQREQWWPYCKDHLYGGWVEDGEVYRWRLAVLA